MKVLAAVSIIGAAVLLALPCGAHAQTYTVLHVFSGRPDGALPYAGLIRDSAGNFYGTTSGGGAFNFGTVFKMTPTGTVNILYSFRGAADQENPWSGLIRDARGNLFGTTFGYLEGGENSNFGTVFRISPTGQETTIHSFAGLPTDGANPVAGLVRDAAGNFYGAVPYGGTGTVCGAFVNTGCGIIYKIDATGKETVLYNFTGGTDGADPYGTLIIDRQGNLYGTTPLGGDLSCNAPYGCGTVFKVDSSGNETVLYSFGAQPNDGEEPYVTLVRDAVGNFYGTTDWGGTGPCSNGAVRVGCGTVFKLDPSGKETVLYSFQGGFDGENPTAGVILDAAGNVYGTVQAGGSTACPAGCGLVFRVDKTGKKTNLHVFKGKDGSLPLAGLIRDAAGNFYGTTLNGGGAQSCGSEGCGVVFKIAP